MRKYQRGFVLLAWLFTYQGVAAMAATYFGAAYAGVNLADSVVKLYHDVQVEQPKAEPAEPVK